MHIDRGEAKPFGVHPELHDFQQPFYRFRRMPVPVLNFSVQESQLADFAARREPFVQRQPLMRVGHEVFGNERRHGELQRGIRLFFYDMAFQPLDGLLDHLHVEVQSNRGDVPGLLFTKQIAGSSDFQVRGGDAESRSQFGELLNGDQPFLRVACKGAFVGDQEIREGLVASTSDAPAQLVELCEAKHVGSVDNDRVRIGHVEAGLDDGRGDQDVRFVFHEFQHDGFQRFGIHLAVCHHHAGFRDQLAQPRPDAFHRFDPVVHEVDLPAPTQFAQDRVPYDLIAGADDFRLDCQAAGRRRIDDREVANARHGHLQRARDGGGRQGQHIDLGTELLEPLLVLHAKPLFFIDDDEAEIRERDVFLKEPVCADHDIDDAGGNIFEDRFRLSGRLEP